MDFWSGMATRIDAVATAHSAVGSAPRGALELARDAATVCFERSGCAPDDIDLLINAGIYRDQQLCEPALAALIQEDIGSGLGAMPLAGRGTFSFDVSNGGVGPLTGIHLIDGLLASKSVDRGMLVASDSDPFPGPSTGYAFPAAGGALLLSRSDDGSGFSDFSFQTFAEFETSFVSELGWKEGGSSLPAGRTGRNELVVQEQQAYALAALDCAERASQDFLKGLGMRAGQIDLVVTSQVPADFSTDFAARLGVGAEKEASVAPEFAGAHTAGPLAALDAAVRSGQFAAAKNTLFVLVGAGIAVGVALYRQKVA
jgi:3-oxoacyl-[acyl-carrier-protein] synthase-3